MKEALVRHGKEFLHICERPGAGGGAPSGVPFDAGQGKLPRVGGESSPALRERRGFFLECVEVIQTHAKISQEESLLPKG